MLRLIPLLVVIDQINAHTALVEWEVGIFTEVSLACLPPNVREGDRLHVRRTRIDTACGMRVTGGPTEWRRRRGASRPRGADRWRGDQ